jgi:hypothetical protein
MRIDLMLDIRFQYFHNITPVYCFNAAVSSVTPSPSNSFLPGFENLHNPGYNSGHNRGHA